jgi:hypothetical protein
VICGDAFNDPKKTPKDKIARNKKGREKTRLMMDKWLLLQTQGTIMSPSASSYHKIYYVQALYTYQSMRRSARFIRDAFDFRQPLGPESYIYALLTLFRRRRYVVPGWAGDREQVFNGQIWATPGKWARKSKVQALALEVGDSWGNIQ